MSVVMSQPSPLNMDFKFGSCPSYNSSMTPIISTPTIELGPFEYPSPTSISRRRSSAVSIDITSPGKAIFADESEEPASTSKPHHREEGLLRGSADSYLLPSHTSTPKTPSTTTHHARSGHNTSPRSRYTLPEIPEYFQLGQSHRRGSIVANKARSVPTPGGRGSFDRRPSFPFNTPGWQVGPPNQTQQQTIDPGLGNISPPAPAIRRPTIPIVGPTRSISPIHFTPRHMMATPIPPSLLARRGSLPLFQRISPTAGRLTPLPVVNDIIMPSPLKVGDTTLIENIDIGKLDLGTVTVLEPVGVDPETGVITPEAIDGILDHHGQMIMA